MILRKSMSPAICLLLLSLSATASHADTFLYTFTGVNSYSPGGDGLSVSFQYSSQGPVTTFTDVLASQLISCTNCRVSSTIPAVEFYPSPLNGTSSFGIEDINQIEFFFFFLPGTFSTPGTYNAIPPDLGTGSLNSGTLTVQDLTNGGGGGGTVPEPSTLVLLLTGVGCVLGRVGRKRLANN